MSSGKVVYNLIAPTITATGTTTMGGVTFPSSGGNANYSIVLSNSTTAVFASLYYASTTYTGTQTVTISATYIEPTLSIYGGSNGGYYLNIPMTAGKTFQITAIGSGTTTVVFTTPYSATAATCSATTSTTSTTGFTAYSVYASTGSAGGNNATASVVLLYAIRH